MNVFLIETTSYNLTEDFVNSKLSDGDELLKYDLKESGIDSLIELLNYQSFNKLHIIINNSYIFNEKITDDESKKVDNLLNVLSSLDESIYIYFSTTSLDNRKKITKTLKSDYNYIDKTINYKNIYSLIDSYVSSNKFKIDYQTKSLLVNKFQLNFDLIVNELEKLFIYFDSTKNITYEEGINIISSVINENIFKFFESCLNKNYTESINLLNELYILKEEPTKLIILLEKEFKNLLLFKLGDKLSGTPDWKLNRIITQANNYTLEELKNIIIFLANLDKDIKSGIILPELSLHYFLIKHLI